MRTPFMIEIYTSMPPTPEQLKEIKHMVAMKLKELEFNDEPRGNVIQRAFVVDE